MIREATLDDGPIVFRLAMAFISTTRYGELYGVNPQQIANLCEYGITKGVVLLEELDHANDCATWCDHPQPSSCTGQDHQCNCAGGVIGMIALAIGPLMLNGQLAAEEIAWWVKPEHRGGRSAYYLLRAAEDWARQKGASVLKMVAPGGSKIGTFYEHRGYVLVESAYQKTLTT